MYYCLLFTTHVIKQINTLHNFRTAKLFRAVVLRVGRTPTAVFLHQVGSSYGLLYHLLRLIPHVPHDGELQLPAVLLLRRSELGGGAGFGPDLLYHLAEVEPAASEPVAALLHGAPHVEQLVPPHVVEGPPVPRLVPGELDPVGAIIHAAIVGHRVSIRHLVRLGSSKLER